MATQDDIDSEYESKIDGINREHEERLSEIKREHEERMTEINTEHERSVKGFAVIAIAILLVLVVVAIIDNHTTGNVGQKKILSCLTACHARVAKVDSKTCECAK